MAHRRGVGSKPPNRSFRRTRNRIRPCPGSTRKPTAITRPTCESIKSTTISSLSFSFSCVLDSYRLIGFNERSSPDPDAPLRHPRALNASRSQSISNLVSTPNVSTSNLTHVNFYLPLIHIISVFDVFDVMRNHSILYLRACSLLISFTD